MDTLAGTKYWQRMYAKPVSDIPWEITSPPEIVVKLIASWQQPKGLALDVGCGTGNYSLYLGTQGFTVLGVDYAKKALKRAAKKHRNTKLNNIFINLDIRSLAERLQSRFDLILDYSVLHHIADADVTAYCDQFSQLLTPQGRLLLVCYTPDHERSQGKKVIDGKYGNLMYFRTRAEIESLYASLTLDSYQQTTLGKGGKHPAHAFIFKV